MSSKYINNSNYAASGYTLSGVYSAVTIGPLGSIGGAGLVGGSTAGYAIVNLGRVAAAAAGAAGIELQADGTIVNGSTTHTTALIDGAAGSAGGRAYYSLNAGGAGGAGIILSQGGSIANSATIAGGTGGLGGIVPFSGYSGYGYYGAKGGGGGAGIVLSRAGSIDNSGRITGGAGGEGGASSPYGNRGGGGGGGGVGVILSQGGSIANSGTIAGGAGGQGSYGYYRDGLGGAGGAGAAGILLSQGGSIANSGLITGGSGGIGVQRGPGGTGGAGIVLSRGGSVDNTGTIVGGSGGAGLDGSPRGTAGDGIVLSDGGIVINGDASHADALIQGDIGITASGTTGATVTNYGTIDGSGGTVVQFARSDDVLVVEAGSKLVGSAVGGGGTLALAGDAGAGTLSGLGTVITNFTTIQFDSDAQWLLGGDAAGLTAGPITGFTIGDTIDLTGFVAVSESFSNNALVLTDSLSSHLTLAIQGSFSTGSFLIPGDGAGGTDITAACFCRGTMILTESGDVPVENLAIGDAAVTLSGEARRIKWIGRRSYDGRFIAGNRAVLPIRIMAGAIGEGVPARDLFVSPEHALFIDRTLVPARLLVNDTSIAQTAEVARLDYFHIELATHDVIFAEGMPAESFVDCDNRGMFHNAGEFGGPDPGDRRPTWDFCAPRLEWDAEELAAIRAALSQRAEALGHALDGAASTRALAAAADRAIGARRAAPPRGVSVSPRRSSAS